MATKGNIVLRFTEDNINLSIVKKSGKNIDLVKSRDFEFSESLGDNGALVYTDKGGDSFKAFIEEDKLSGKSAKVIIAQDGIITRLVQSPRLSKKDLDKFIGNNIDEYFTLNIKEYDYDYTIVKEEKGEASKFTILLVLFPKNKLQAITEYVKSHNLEIDTVTIYPVCIENLFHIEKDKSLAVFEVSEDRTNITILEKGTIFLYSRTNSEIDELHGEYDEVLDSLLYFLNFYSTRHFGNRVDKIYITGKLWNNQEFQDALKELTPVNIVSGVKLPNAKIEAKEGSDKNLFADVIGTLLPVKRKYNKDINFARLHKVAKKKNENKPIILLAALLGAVTIMWPAVFTLSKEARLRRYDTAELIQKRSALQEVEANYNQLMDIENALLQRETSKKLLEAMNIDYTPYIEELREVLPKGTYIKSFNIDPMYVSMSFVVNGTIDKVVLAESLNKSSIFEKINIQDIRLDDSEREAQFEVKILKPLKGE